MTSRDSLSAVLAHPASELVVTADAEPAEWDRFISAAPSATGDHLWGWRRVIKDAFGHQSQYLVARRDRTIVGVLPLVLFRSALFGRFGVSLPFLNYGGVVAQDAAAADALLGAALELGRQRRMAHVELRHLDQQFPQLPVKQHKVTMWLQLAPSVDAQWTALDRKIRNQVRKAEKSGLATETGGLELVEAFYSVFARNMRDLGTPVYSKRFFELVLSEFPDRARVTLVKDGPRAVGGAISCRFRDTLSVPWASSLREYGTSSPNTLLYWTLLQEAIRAGCSRFDFGRSTPNEGTYQFKKQWGAQPVGLAWEYVLLSANAIPDQGPKNPKFKLAIGLWKRLPLAVTNAAGPAIARSIP